MSISFLGFDTAIPRRRQYLLVGICGLLPFAACETQDPRPGSGSGTTSSATTSGNTGSGGRIDFGNGGQGGSSDDTNHSGDGDGDGDSGNGDPGDGDTGDGDPGDGDTGDGDGDTGPGITIRKCGAAPVSDQEFSKKALLESAGVCSAYQACLFSNATIELGRGVTKYVDEPSADNLELARANWRSAMQSWSAITPTRYGPIASTATDKYHGRGIGAFIHAWPALNRCEIEKQVVTRAYQEQGFQRILPGARGLSALEYLLFTSGSDTVCASNSSTAKLWAELSSDELQQAKLDYAQAVVGDIYLKAEEYMGVWDADGENFGQSLANHEGYGSQQEALNVVAGSLLYPYDVVRDLKVGPLAGIGTAILNPETPYAQIDVQNIQANIKAFRALFQGCGPDGAGLGFDDWLKAAGGDDLEQDLLQALDTIEARAADLPPLHEASTEQMAAFYADLKVLSDLLKEQFFGSGSVLNLKLPASAASDTD